MKKLIISICVIVCSVSLYAQNPMDERLYDEVKLKIGDDATEISACAFGGTKKEGKPREGSCSLTLNKDVLYRFTCGNSKKSTAILEQKLISREDNQLIKVIEVKEGDISSFEFMCKKTGKYSIQSFYNGFGYCWNVTIISKVNIK
ncbi:hypothetical protein EYV94_03220 [Puteibacter caeruleilacunae]|nr:hypothetical protein EYV94_03220 [Puteibacter caeruleilacunae]